MKIVIVAAALVMSSVVAEAAPVDVALDPCLGPSRDEIRRVLVVELGESLEDSFVATPDRSHASIACDGAVAVLRVDDPEGNRTLWRRLDRETSSPRIVALALAELLETLETERTGIAPVVAASEVSAAPGAAGVIATLPQRSHAPRYRVTVAAGALVFSDEGTTLGGLGVRAAVQRRTSLGVMIDGQVHHGSTTTTLGGISTDLASIGLGPVLRVGAYTRLGAGLRGGVARMSGSAMANATGSSFASPWFGPMVLADVAVPLTERLAVDASAEIGYVAAPVSALVNGMPAASIDGTWAQLHIGVSVAL